MGGLINILIPLLNNSLGFQPQFNFPFQSHLNFSITYIQILLLRKRNQFFFQPTRQHFIFFTYTSHNSRIHFKHSTYISVHKSRKKTTDVGQKVSKSFKTKIPRGLRNYLPLSSGDLSFKRKRIRRGHHSCVLGTSIRVFGTHHRRSRLQNNPFPSAVGPTNCIGHKILELSTHLG